MHDDLICGVKNDKIPFLVTKRGQILNLISDLDPRLKNVVWLYLLLLHESDQNMLILVRGNNARFTHKLSKNTKNTVFGYLNS